MTPRQDSASSTELEEGTNAGGAAPPEQGALSKDLAEGAEVAAAGADAAPEPGAPRMELDPRTKVALAGQMLAHGEVDFLDPAICLVCNNHTFGEAAAVTSSCGHPFHPKCIEDAMKLDKTQCPCGAAFPPGEKPVVATPAYKRIMDNHKVQCPQGCGEVTPFGHLHQHVHNASGCSNTPYRCGNAGCGVLFLRKDKDEHLSSCPHRLVHCELCEQLIKDRDLLQHKAEQCPRRKIRCPHCQGEHLFCDTEEHMRRCSGGVSMRNITELKEMMAQMQQTIARQGKTIEHQQSEIAELRGIARPLERLAVPQVAESLERVAASDILRRYPDKEPSARGLIEQEREESMEELRRLDLQQMQRVPGLAEARLREAAARAAIEQEQEQSLAELHRLDEQQSQRVPGMTEARERAALPQILTVTGCWAGEYSLRPERVNGAAVWGRGTYRLYRSREGQWVLTHEADGPQRNRGRFRLSSQPGSRAPLGGGWEYNGGHDDMSRADSWRPYPQLSVTAP